MIVQAALILATAYSGTHGADGLAVFFGFLLAMSVMS